jgi:galactokinase/mevalonate kinase-like predicted kinase
MCQVDWGPKIHRVFFLGLICEVFGPRILQKCCLPSMRTGLGSSSSLLVGSFFDFEPFFKRTSPCAYVRLPYLLRQDVT